MNSAFKIIPLIWFFWLNLQAQKFPIKEYNVDDGLPQSTVNTIYQDSKGYLWFGTYDGISRFDGISFLNLSTEAGLIDKTIRSIHEDNTGILWIATDKGISKYDGSKFENLTSKFLVGDDIPCWVVEGSKQGAVWAGTKGKGVILFERGSTRVFTSKDGVINDTIYSLLSDNKGGLWIGTQSGISYFNGNKFESFSIESGLPLGEVRSLFIKSDGTLWASVKGFGVGSLINGKFRFYTTKNGLINNNVYSIEEDLYGNLWFGTAEGSSKFDGDKFSSLTTLNGLTSPIVYSIKRDLEGSLWFGLVDGGINQLRNEKFLSYNVSSGLPNDVVYSIAEDNSGNIWIGTDLGLSVVSDNKVKNYTTSDGLPDNSIRAISRGQDGSMWFATSKGACRYQNGKFLLYGEAQGMSDGSATALFADSKGNIWVGSDVDGIFKYDGIKFVNYKSSNEIILKNIESICEDSEGNIWIATYDHGIFVYNGKGFTTFKEQNEIFKNSCIYDIHADKKGNVFISTKNDGFFIYKDKQFTQFNGANGLPNNVCYFCESDEKGNLWVGTNAGLARFDGKLFRSYTNKAGLITNEFNSGAVLKDSKGFFWFGTIKGLIKFDSRLDRINDTPPPVFITKFRIFEKDAPLTQGRVLSYNENYIKFDFKALSFNSPEEIVYQYKLVGVDNDWQFAKQTNVQYTELKAGDYEFLVQAKNSDGIWSKMPASFKFVILPPWWERTWVRVSFVLMLIGGIYIFYVIRTVQLKSRNIELARLVKERTKELELEKNKSDNLLLNILPASTVKELKDTGTTIPREFKSISILFTDFQGFTNISSTLNPSVLVFELNDVFVHFDAIIEKYGLEKLKTIGDSYMIAGGIPVETEDHAVKIILAGLELQEFLTERNKISQIQWHMRVGVHSGNVIAGVVGKRKFSYDVWGDTVNVASRMESNGEPGRINISQATYLLVKDYFECEYRGKVLAKGKGEIDMYFVDTIKRVTLQRFPYATITEVIIVD